MSDAVITDKNQSFVREGEKGALFDESRIYRYSLWRRWGFGSGIEAVTLGDMVTFIGLNPSTADESEDDPTIRRCIGFAKQWGFGGLVMLNIFAFRATDPKDMKKQLNPIGKLNDAAIQNVTDRIGRTVCAWGVHGAWMNRGAAVRAMVRGTAFHLGQTKQGFPKHPLYLASDTELSGDWE